MTKTGVKSGAPERWPLIELLAPLGWSTKQIAEVIGCSQATVAKDLGKRGGMKTLWPDRPRKKADIYAATFRCYAQHTCHPPPAIRDLLNMETIERVQNGMEGAFMVMTRPGLHWEDPYFKLLEVVDHGLCQGQKCPWLLEEYLKDVNSGAVPLPENSGQVINALKLRLSQLNRSLLISSNMEAFRKDINGLLERKCDPGEEPLLTAREATIIKMRYGLGGEPPKSLVQIGEVFEVTSGRIRQIEGKALRKLRWARTYKGLLDPFTTMGELRGDRDKARSQLQLLTMSYNDLAGLHNNVCDAVMAGNLEAAQRFLNLKPEEQGLSNLNLWRRLDELDLSVRTANCLENAGLEHVWQVCSKSEQEMLKTRNFGRKPLNELKGILKEMRLRLGMDMSILRSHTRIEDQP
jgi:hypothetical protein